METNRRKREPVRLGTHGENYGNWMSAPVFYMVGALVVLMAAYASYRILSPAWTRSEFWRSSLLQQC